MLFSVPTDQKGSALRHRHLSRPEEGIIVSRPAVLVVVPEELLRSLRRARAPGRVEEVRGGRAAQPRLIELFKQRIDPARPVVASIAHAKAPVWADRLRLPVAESVPGREWMRAEVGAGGGE